MSGADELDSLFLQEEAFAFESPVKVDPRLERFALQSPFAMADYQLQGRRQVLKTPILAKLGKPDFLPDVVYIVRPDGDSFLKSASQFHALWGLKVVEFDTLEGLIGLIVKAKPPGRRIRVVSHAWDGFLIPLFKGSPKGFSITQKQIEALNNDDGALMDEFLEKLTDLSLVTDKGELAWKALLKHIERNDPDVLAPFKLSSGTQPSGDSELVLRRCADLVTAAGADPAIKTAVRKSIAGALSRLGRTKAEGDALTDAVRRSGFTFSMNNLNQDFVQRIKAAVGAIDNRAFRKAIKDVQKSLKGKWIDFRGCRIGSQKPYLEAFAALMGAAGCTAPDRWSGYPGEAPINDKQIKTASVLADIVKSSKAAEDAMNRWGARELSGWKTGDARRFFDEFLKAGNGVLPVYEPEYTPAGLKKETYTLFWTSPKAKQRWLESMWDANVTKQAQKVAAAWGSKTPRMPTLSLHLKASSSTSSNPQRIFVAPEPEFRDHIIEVINP